MKHRFDFKGILKNIYPYFLTAPHLSFFTKDRTFFTFSLKKKKKKTYFIEENYPPYHKLHNTLEVKVNQKIIIFQCLWDTTLFWEN